MKYPLHFSPAWRLGLALAAVFAGRASAAGPAPTIPAEARYVLADGSLQIVGNADMAGMIERLNALYAQRHPGFKFKYIRANNLAAAHALVFDTTAFAPMGTASLGTATTPYPFIVKADPFGVRIAHASLAPAANISPLGIIVHPSNPTTTLSTAQIGRIFASGGRKWDITRWGQTGLSGDWKFREIHPVGLPESNHYPSEDNEFAEFMFQKNIGGDQPALGYERVTTYADVVTTVAGDPKAIGIAALNRVTPGVKVVALTNGGWTKPSTGSAADIVAGKYPYDRYLYIFMRREAGSALNSFQESYLRLVLSPEGQDIIAHDPLGYLPLNPVELALEVGKLE